MEMVLTHVLSSAGADQVTLFLGLWALLILAGGVIFVAVTWGRMR